MGRQRGIDKIDADEELQAITRGLKRILRERTATLEKATRDLEQSEEKLRLMFEAISDGIFVTDLEGNIVEVNEAALRISGYSQRGELVGQSAFEFLLPQDRPIAMEGMAKTLQEGRSGEEVGFTILAADGRALEVEFRGALLRDSSGNPAGIIGTVRDITERKRMEERIEHLNSVLRAIRNVNQLVSRENDRDRLLQGACDNLVETRGYYNAWIAIIDESPGLVTTAEAGLDQEFLPLVEQMRRGELPACSRRALQQSGVVVTEDPSSACADCPLAETYTGRGAMTSRLEHAGKVYGLLSTSIPTQFTADEEEHALFQEVAADIAFALHSIELKGERKRAEEELTRLSNAVRMSTDSIVIGDLAANIIEVNEATLRMYGTDDKRDLIGKNALDLIAPEDWEKTLADREEVLQRGYNENVEYHIITKDGGRVLVEMSTAIMKGADGKPTGLVAVSRDITERKRIEEELVRLSNAVRMASDSIVISDLEANIIEVNEATLKMYGTDHKGDLVGKNALDLIAPEDQGKALAGVQEALEKGYYENVEYHIITKDGGRILVEMNSAIMKGTDGKPIGFVAVSRDITERKRMGQALRESQEKYRRLVENINDGYVVVTSQGRVAFANAKLAQISGYELEEIIGMDAVKLVPPDMAPHLEKTLQMVEQHQQLTERLEGAILKKDGEVVPVELSYKAIDYEGKPAVTAIIRDITERKRMEQALRESEQKYRALFESGLEGVLVIDAETMKAVLGNQTAAKMYGFDSAEDVIGVNPLDFVHPHDKERALRIIAEDMFEKDMRQVNEFRTVTRDGKEKWISAVGTTIEYQGKLAGVVSVSDVTERKRAERMVMERTAKLEKAKRELEETASHLRTLQAITEVGLSRMGLDEMLNKLLRRFLKGMESRIGAIMLLDKEGKQVPRAMPAPGWEIFSKKKLTIDTKEAPFDMLLELEQPMVFRDTDLAHFPISKRLKNFLREWNVKSMLGVPLRSGGKAIGFIAALWEGSRQFTPQEMGLLEVIADRAATAIEFHRLNEETRKKSVELEQKNIELQRGNELKSEFLANMSHELRTPMNAIMGYTSLMLRERYGTLTEKQAEALWRVDRNAKNLLILINSILDLSKIEAGKMPLYNEAVDLREVMEEAISTVEPMVREAKLALETAMAEDIPALWTDRSKLKQIILNLLSNAVKFTPKGGITVSAWGSEGHVKVAVNDTGIGIKEDDLKIIFEEFRQVDGSTTRDQGGSGLGLAIAKKFANLLGGDIEVESVYGQGSTFTITIPCIAPPQPPKRMPEPIAEVPARPITAAKTLLAIDDDPDIIALLQENLVDTDYEVVGALNGEEGIRRAAELQPFAITLDILMPHRDGWYVIHKLKSDPKTAHIPVIIISIIEEKHLAYSLGVADYIVKPIERDLLISKLKRLERVGQREALVVDDDPKVVNLLRDILQGEGYTVRAASTERDAIAEIEAKPPDYLFLDIEMLEINSFDVLNHVEKKPYGKKMIIVVTSARDLTPEERDFLSKRASIMMEKSELDRKESVDELKLALTAAQDRKGVRGNEAEDSGGRG